MGCNPGEAMYDKKGNGSKLLPSPKFYLEVIQYTSNYKVIIRWGSFLPHVLVHFVKSAWLYSVNPFSTLFSANIQRNCPILFCTCPTYLPAGLAFRFSIQKQPNLVVQGKLPPAPSNFEWMSYSYRYIQIKSAGLIVILSNSVSVSGWFAEFSRLQLQLQPQLQFIQLQHQQKYS